MKTIEIKCRVITPMFLAGADGKTAELRPSSIKGAMRFWWRAIKGYSDLSKLHKEESKIFGSSDDKYGRSKFSIRVLCNNLQTENYNPLPHRNNNQFSFNGIKENQDFTILISTKNENENENENEINNYVTILKISLLLGGLGKRKRRGFGSVMYNYDEVSKLSSDELLEKITEMLNNINNDFEIKNETINEKNVKKISRKSELNSNYPSIMEIFIGSRNQNSEELLRKIGQASHNCEDPVLGFVKGKLRMASPLYVTVVRLQDGFYPLITKLKVDINFLQRRNIRFNVDEEREFIKCFI